MEWIKAKHDSPKDSDNYHVKVLDKDGDGYVFPAVLCFTMGMWEVMEDHHEVIEWLDESATELLTSSSNDGWFSVGDGLPELNKHEESDYLLCYTEFREQVVCFYSKERGGWTVANHTATNDIFPHTITHFKPLPSPPKN